MSGNNFFGRFLLRLSRINSFQVMSMVKFIPTAFNFGYDFVLLVHFLGHPVYSNLNIMLLAPLNMHSHQGREDPGPETGKCPPGKGENLEKNKKG